MARSANVVDVHDSTFERDVIQKSFERPVVVDFWAEWCGPCHMLGPVLERLADEPDSNFILAKVDVDANPGLAMRFGVRGIPAVKAFQNGEVAAEFVGAQPEPRVRQFLSQLAPSSGNGQGAVTPDSLLAERRYAEAQVAFEETIGRNGSDARARLGLAKALLGQGKGCASKTVLDDLLEVPAVMAATERLMPLAEFLCAAEQRQDDDEEITPIEAQYRQSARLLAREKFAPALDGLLEVLRYNKSYRNGQAKAVMLAVFELLGDEDPLTNAYRREMASVLF
jgi:putative thioredoxin